MRANGGKILIQEKRCWQSYWLPWNQHPDVAYGEPNEKMRRKLCWLDDEPWLLSLGYRSRSLTGYYLPTHATPRAPDIRSPRKQRLAALSLLQDGLWSSVSRVLFFEEIRDAGWLRCGVPFYVWLGLTKWLTICCAPFFCSWGISGRPSLNRSKAF